VIGATAKLVLAATVSVAASLIATTVVQAGSQAIVMAKVAYAPPQVTVHVGDTLEWTNDDIVAHTATSKEAGFNVNVLPGHKASAVVKTPGTFTYSCRYHPNMKGQIVVEP
jgi:plastocyanin